MTSMSLKEETAEKVVLSCCVLHNFLIKHQPQAYLRQVCKEHTVLDPTDQTKWASPVAMTNLQNLKGNNDTTDGKLVRSYLADYYMNAYQLNWQQEYGNWKTLIILQTTNILMKLINKKKKKYKIM